MDIERAMEILKPGTETYETFEEMEEACRMGYEALKEKLTEPNKDVTWRYMAKIVAEWAAERDRQNEPLTVRINTHGGKMPEQYGEWIDLTTAEDAFMDPLEFKIISLGVSMELPEGYYAQVVPRSSTCKRYGIVLANSMGIIEHDYCGDNDVWGFPAVAIRHTHIPAGTRICQFCLMKKHRPVVFEAVESLGNKDRGGWGSTGTN